MIMEPVMRPTILLTVVISMKRTQITSLLLSQWVSKLLTLLQLANRVDCGEELLENCTQGPTGFFGRIVTRDETWICHYELLSQQEAKSWKKPGEETPTRSRVT